jgi:hypothetical protein
MNSIQILLIIILIMSILVGLATIFYFATITEISISEEKNVFIPKDVYQMGNRIKLEDGKWMFSSDGKKSFTPVILDKDNLFIIPNILSKECFLKLIVDNQQKMTISFSIQPVILSGIGSKEGEVYNNNGKNEFTLSLIEDGILQASKDGLIWKETNITINVNTGVVECNFANDVIMWKFKSDNIDIISNKFILKDKVVDQKAKVV